MTWTSTCDADCGCGRTWTAPSIPIEVPILDDDTASGGES